MRITWVGVPVDARKFIRKELRANHVGSEFLVCSDKGADQKVRAHIRESLWAFNAEFIARHSKGNLDTGAIKALKAAQEKLCEDANELVFSMIKSFRAFWRDAVSSDGRGHFLSGYDGEEREISDGMATTYYVYRNN